MGENTPNQPEIQLCSMRIAFPVTSDEQAIEYKKKITAVLSDLDSVRMGFDLTTMPAKTSMPNVPL